MAKGRFPDSPSIRLTLDQRIGISTGHIDGYEQFKTIATVDSVASGTTSVIWSQGGPHTFPDVDGESLFISSSSASDTNSLLIQALDGNGDEAPLGGFIDPSNATLQGQTKVTVGGGTYRSMQDAFYNSDTANVGDIYIYTASTVTAGVPDDATAIQAKIIATHNRAQTGWFDTPNNKRAFELQLDYYASTVPVANPMHRSVEFQQWVKPPGGVFQLVIRTPMDIGANGHASIPLDFPSPGISGTLVEFRVVNNTSVEICAAVFVTSLLIREEFLDFSVTTPSQGIPN